MMNPDAQSIRRFAEEYAAAWCSQNPVSVAAFYDENGSLSVNEGEPAIGREAITHVAQEFMTALPDMKVVMDNLSVEDNTTIFHWTLTGTNTGPGGTGHSVRISGFEFWDLGANGLIANSRGHFDSDEYRRQLGS